MGSENEASKVTGNNDEYKVASKKNDLEFQSAERNSEEMNLIPESSEYTKILKGSADLKTKVIYLLKVLALGQVLALCISGTSTFSNALAENLGISIPTTQTFLEKTRYEASKKLDLLLAIADVEGNYFVVKAYNYTNLLSCSLLDTWTLPCVVVFTYFFMKVKYKKLQYVSIFICLVGMGASVFIDNYGKQGYRGQDPLKGDLFMILGATCYAVSNIMLEYIVRKRPIYEALGYLGLLGTIVNGVQLLALELNEIKNTTWTGQVVGYNLGFVAFMLLLYSLTPVLFRMSSATFYNLSLLTSDIYILLVGIFVFDYDVTPFYTIAYVLVISGLVIFNISPSLASDSILKLKGFN
ncbi:putative solute carrier family 35 member [Smittium culicis]|uniref:Putative solute carrier family 35 member n=1 Tax=Smittium culicis TaxID=133412 RepID=A0A1R1XSX9_9FUNG|nr:putative solute carrier family 35 member [Smittium culicis]